MKMFRAKVIRTPEATLVNVCDGDLLGKEFREGDVILRVAPSFYGGDEVDEATLNRLLDEGDIISLVGERCIGVAVKRGLATWSSVKRISGIPHLNIYRL